MSDLARASASSLTAPVSAQEVDEKALRSIMPQGATATDVHVFRRLCNHLGLDPFLKEIYALPDRKRNGMSYVVGVDGWCRIITQDPRFRGVEFEEEFDAEGRLLSITCTLHVDGWLKPVVIRERLNECRRSTEPWTQMPSRMLRHAALKQAGRLAFGLSGITDPDEHEASQASADSKAAPAAAGAAGLNAALVAAAPAQEAPKDTRAAQDGDGPAEGSGRTEPPGPAGGPSGPSAEDFAAAVAAKARELGVRQVEFTTPGGVLRVARERASQGDGDVIAELSSMSSRLDSKLGALINGGAQ